MITLIDYGIGNLGSVQNMLRRIGAEFKVESQADAIAGAEKLILPGVGAFDSGMEALETRELDRAIVYAVTERKRPILGICLGMQLLSSGSDEGKRPGLNLHRSRTVRIPSASLDGQPLRVPHMGWNAVSAPHAHPLTNGLPADARFYFVHSYHVVCEDPTDVILQCQYGAPLAAAFAHENLMGVQFHPEKSHMFGITLFKNFAQRF